MTSFASHSPATTPLHFGAAAGTVEVKPVAAPKVDPNVLAKAEGSARFAGEIQQLNLRNARLGAWFVMVLVPFCSVLDWLAYPEFFWDFLQLRLLCSLLCVPLLLALDQSWAARYHRVYPVILPLLPALAISLMIYLSGDAGSGYYTGLLLCLVGTSFVFHWTFQEIGLTVGLVLACYFAATLPNVDYAAGMHGNAHFINNTIFTLLTCLVLYFGSRQHHGIRLREFVNRCKVEAQREELRNRNEELTSTLRLLRETEAQLVQSEKLASIGRLSAGIVHEINNPLNFVQTAVFLLKKKAKAMEPEQGDPLNEILTDISEGVGRVASIVSDLRIFAHPESRGASPVDLGNAVRKTTRLMNKQLGDINAEFIINIPPKLVVLGDENHIIQIFINLLQNSFDAMSCQKAPKIILSAARTGEGVEVRIRDNGDGITEDVLQKIFDPFFTTKDVGKGMGLGLSLCYRMMQGMNGTISATSQPGQHTEFTLTFRPTDIE